MARPKAKHGTTNRWRTQCRCWRCRRAHNADDKDRRRRVTEARFPPAVRAKVLRLVEGGKSPAQAARALDITVQSIYSWIRIDPQWRQDLDDALMAGRDPLVPHGRATGYRHHGCRCPECRAVHHPPGPANAVDG